MPVCNGDKYENLSLLALWSFLLQPPRTPPREQGRPLAADSCAAFASASGKRWREGREMLPRVAFSNCIQALRHDFIECGAKEGAKERRIRRNGAEWEAKFLRIFTRGR
jgi:hypothetical protein